MANNEGEVMKTCPWDKECATCLLYHGLKQVAGGLQRTAGGACAFNALVVMLSEINTRTQSLQQLIQAPRLYRG